MCSVKNIKKELILYEDDAENIYCMFLNVCSHRHVGLWETDQWFVQDEKSV